MESLPGVIPSWWKVTTVWFYGAEGRFGFFLTSIRKRFDKVFIAIDLPDAQDVKLKLEPKGKLFFSVTSGADKIPYEVDLDLCYNVDVNESKAKCWLEKYLLSCQKGREQMVEQIAKTRGKTSYVSKMIGISGLTRIRRRMKNVSDNGEFRKATIEETRLGGRVWQDGCRLFYLIF